MKLINNGIGQTELTSVELYVDDKLITHNHDSWGKALKTIGLDPHNWFFMRLSLGTTIHADEELWLIRTSSLYLKANDAIHSLNRMKVVIEYKSMYNKQQPAL